MMNLFCVLARLRLICVVSITGTAISLVPNSGHCVVECKCLSLQSVRVKMDSSAFEQ